MFKKRLLKFFDRLFDNDYVKIFLYIAGLLVIFVLWHSFNSGSELLPALLDVLQGDVAISVFVAGLLSILLKHLFMMMESGLEDSLKTEDDHHKIIQRYDGHRFEEIDTTQNFFDKEGVGMALHQTTETAPRNHYRDKHSADYKSLQEEIALFENEGILRLPTVNVYTNVLGDTDVKFYDSTKDGEIPSFIINNAGTIFSAHKHSRTTNNVTVRLRDLEVHDGALTLMTERSSYYRMLLTNRCMDFELENGMTVRNLFEYKKTVSPLAESKMSNQIGINGVIMTKDGYLLIEKRDKKKTTWKNKFAQPISLALKEEDLCGKGRHLIGPSVEEANAGMFSVIKKTMKTNFGLVEGDFDPLCFKNNFLGVARDLLEGGKPNLYFSVTVHYTAKELLVKLREAATKTGKDALKTEKLSAEYYLVPFDLMRFSFNYVLKLKKSEIYRVDRWVAPRINPIKVFYKRLFYRIYDKINRYTDHEVGEALLVCCSYLELCRARLPAIKEKGEPRHE